MNNKVEKYQLVYNLAKKFLDEHLPAGISDKELKTYLENKKEFLSLNDIFKRMIISLQNYQSMPKVINFEKNYEKMKMILLDFNPKLVFKEYDVNSLYNQFVKNFKISNPESRNNSWLKFTKGIISGAKFLNNFKDHKEFDEFVNRFDLNEITLAALPFILKTEIFGLGFALSCDFLKELGYTNYPKPDVHLMDIFSSLGLSEYDQYDNYKKILEMSKAVNKKPYEVDKVLWLICSGKYYSHNITTKPMKQELIKYLIDNINKEPLLLS